MDEKHFLRQINNKVNLTNSQSDINEYLFHNTSEGFVTNDTFNNQINILQKADQLETQNRINQDNILQNNIEENREYVDSTFIKTINNQSSDTSGNIDTPKIDWNATAGPEQILNKPDLSLKVNKAGDEMSGPLTIAAGDGKGILFKDKTSNINIIDGNTRTLVGFLNNAFTLGYPDYPMVIRGNSLHITDNEEGKGKVNIQSGGNAGFYLQGISTDVDYTKLGTADSNRVLFLQPGTNGTVTIGGDVNNVTIQGDKSAKLIVHGDIKENHQFLKDKYQSRDFYTEVTTFSDESTATLSLEQWDDIVNHYRQNINCFLNIKIPNTPVEYKVKVASIQEFEGGASFMYCDLFTESGSELGDSFRSVMGLKIQDQIILSIHTGVSIPAPNPATMNVQLIADGGMFSWSDATHSYIYPINAPQDIPYNSTDFINFEQMINYYKQGISCQIQWNNLLFNVVGSQNVEGVYLYTGLNQDTLNNITTILTIIYQKNTTNIDDSLLIFSLHESVIIPPALNNKSILFYDGFTNPDFPYSWQDAKPNLIGIPNATLDTKNTVLGVNDIGEYELFVDKYLLKTGDTINGDLIIQGNLTVQGTTTSLDVETVSTKDNIIELATGRDQNTGIITPVGLEVRNYDGRNVNNALQIVIDNEGTAKVGNVLYNEDGTISPENNHLQALATRENLKDQTLVKWDADKIALVPDTTQYAVSVNGNKADSKGNIVVPEQVNANWTATEGKGVILNKPNIPSKVSELENDKNYLTEHQDISGKADKTYVDEQITAIELKPGPMGPQGPQGKQPFFTINTNGELIVSYK